MKIRWNSKSVRLRITPSEMEALSRFETVTETLEVANLRWTAIIFSHRTKKRTDVVTSNNEFLIRLAKADLVKLSDPETEGVYFSTGGANAIKYFIEKDYPCAHPRASQAEENSETFVPSARFEARKKKS